MDWKLTCRVCLSTGDMVSLFDWDENNEQLVDMYAYCCGIEVSKDDTLPTLICLICVDRLTSAYRFKQQCISSTETLKACMEEFTTSEAEVGALNKENSETETISIKQENGMLLQYEVPVEHDAQFKWTRTLTKNTNSTVVTKAPFPRKRGRPRKYPDSQGQINISPYQRKRHSSQGKEEESISSLLASESFKLKEEPQDEEPFQDDNYGDPDFNPTGEEQESDSEIQKEMPPKRRGRPPKVHTESKNFENSQDSEDFLLKETIMAYSEPIPDHLLNPKKKKKGDRPKKRYVYEKTHICETCGVAFTSNASLQAHIRRHLGIKPFVCSICGYSCVLNMELNRHMMRHTGVRPYKCRVCDRRFGDFGSRQKHERLHMGLRPYQCTICGKAFTYSYVLSNHMLTHTGEKKYSCEPCNKKFTKSHHLKYHTKVHHKDLYIKQQLENEKKRISLAISVDDVNSATSGQVVNGTLQFINTTFEEGEQKTPEDDNYKETDRAVADMQAVVLGTDFCIQDEEKKSSESNFNIKSQFY